MPRQSYVNTTSFTVDAVSVSIDETLDHSAPKFSSASSMSAATHYSPNSGWPVPPPTAFFMTNFTAKVEPVLSAFEADLVTSISRAFYIPENEEGLVSLWSVRMATVDDATNASLVGFIGQTLVDFVTAYPDILDSPGSFNVVSQWETPFSRDTARIVTIVITGSGFAIDNVSVTVGGDACVIAVGAGTTTTQITCTSAAKAAGTHAVVVTNTVTSGTSNSDVVVTYVAPPVVTSVSPSSRDIAGIVTIVITGSEFAIGDVSVTVGGDACVIAVGAGTTTTQITCTSAAKAAGTHAVVVTNTVTSVASNSDVVVTYVGGVVVTNATDRLAGTDSYGTPGSADSDWTIPFSSTPFTQFLFSRGDCAKWLVADKEAVGGVWGPSGSDWYESALRNVAKSSNNDQPHQVVWNNRAADPDGDPWITLTDYDGENYLTIIYVEDSNMYEWNDPSGANVYIRNLPSVAPPVVTSVSPSSRDIAGIVTIVITGSEFAIGDVSVTVGGDACVIAVGAGTTTTQITCTSPAKAAGTYAVVVTNTVTSDASNSNVVVTYVAPPVVTSVSPSSRDIAGIVTIVITGSEFAIGDVSVTVGGDACVIAVGAGTTTTQITCTSPAKAAGTYAVVVTNTVTSGASNSNVVVTYVAPPVVTSVSPSSRDIAGIVTIVITGSEFTISDVSVTVGGDACVIAVGAGTTTTQITCTSPAKAAGTYAVVVTNTVTSDASNSDVVVTYVAPPVVTSVSPSSRDIAGIVTIVITGSEFAIGDVSVTVGGDACVIAVGAGTTTTQITCTSAAKAAGTHAVVVTNTVTSVASNSDVVVTYVGGVVVTNDCGLAIDGGGWTLVRHIPDTHAWHPATDRLAGTDSYGTPGSADSDWTIPFSSTPFTQFLFSRGDCAKWLVADKEAVGGVWGPSGSDWYESALRNVAKSSNNDQPHQVVWNNRAADPDGDPWITLTDYDGENYLTILYVEDSNMYEWNDPSGANVYIRNLPSVAPPVVTSVSPSSRDIAGIVTIVITGSEFAIGDVSVTVGGDACVIAVGADCGLAIDGGGWTLVRHIPDTHAWHPATDRLAGTDSYGTPGSADSDWTIPFSSTPFTQFLFSRGDCAKWLVADKEAVGGVWGPSGSAWYESALRNVAKSSNNDQPHQVVWNSRAADPDGDPWITLTDYDGENYLTILYVEDSNMYEWNDPSGANVYIRNLPSVAPPVVASVSPSSRDIAGIVTIVITGSEFAIGDVSVTVGGDACVIAVGAGTTTTQITCTSAAKAAGTHAVVVTNTVTSGASNSDVVVTYVAPPVVASVSPSSRDIAGIVTIVITGSEFAIGDVSVTVGGDACVIAVGAGTTTTQITCTSAAKAAGTHAVVVTNTVTSVASNSDVVVTYVGGVVVTNDCGLAIDGGGWTLVRHIPDTHAWHPATDRLAGTDSYGTPGSADSDWTIPFSSTPFTQFLFSRGDCAKWLVADKEAVGGVWGISGSAWYELALRNVAKSSNNDQPHQVVWNNRAADPNGDPCITLTDNDSENFQTILYVEDSNIYEWNDLSGAHVYIRFQTQPR
eukprot:gene30309-35298_t